MKASDFLELAELLCVDERWDWVQAYCRRAVKMNNAESEKSMDLSKYDEIQELMKLALGDPAPRFEMEVCLRCHQPMYPGEKAYKFFHVGCEHSATLEELPKDLVEDVVTWAIEGGWSP